MTWRGGLRQLADGDWSLVANAPECAFVGVELGSVDGPGSWKVVENVVQIVWTLTTAPDGSAVYEVVALDDESPL
jgi:hypothetical protein